MRRSISLLGAAAFLVSCAESADQTGEKNGVLTITGVEVSARHDESHLQSGAKLTGEAERPIPRETPAHGSAMVHFKLQEDGLHYVLVVNQIENVTQAHIHLGGPETAGGIVAWLYPSPENRTAVPGGAGPHNGLLAQGVINASDLVGSLAGQPLSALITHIRNNNAYVNVHTSDGVAPADTGPGDFPGGEVRGQLEVRGNK